MWLDFSLHAVALVCREPYFYLTSMEPALEMTLCRYCVLFVLWNCYLLTVHSQRFKIGELKKTLRDLSFKGECNMCMGSRTELKTKESSMWLHEVMG